MVNTRKALQRSIGLSGGLLLTLSAITPASSVFVILPEALRIAGSGILLAMLAALAVGIGMAWIYAELSSALPRTGGEYVFVAHVLGALPGFMFLGLTLVGAVLSPAVLALGAGQYISALAPGWRPAPVAAAIITGATLLGVLNIRTNSWITGSVLALELVVLCFVAFLGFAHASTPLTELLMQPVVLHGGQMQPASLSLIGAATALAIFAYNGYGNAVYFSEEIHDATRRVARTVLWALALGVATQLVPVAAVLIGTSDLDDLLRSESPFNDFVIKRAGHAANVAVSIGVALAMINAVIILMLSNARLLYSTGRDRVWPAGLNEVLTRIDVRFHSPWVATLLAGMLSIAPCWIDLEVLLIFTGTSLIAIYGGICIAALRGRTRGRTSHSAYRMPLFPLAPLGCLAALAYVAYQNWLDPKIGRPSLVANFVVMACAALYYVFVLKRRGPWVLHDPDAQRSE